MNKLTHNRTGTVLHDVSSATWTKLVLSSVKPNLDALLVEVVSARGDVPQHVVSFKSLLAKRVTVLSIVEGQLLGVAVVVVEYIMAIVKARGDVHFSSHHVHVEVHHIQLCLVKILVLNIISEVDGTLKMCFQHLAFVLPLLGVTRASPKPTAYVLLDVDTDDKQDYY